MAAKPIVDGLQEQLNDSVEVVHLNLLSAVGREAARRYGIKIVPATLVFDRQGQLVERQMGIPNAERLVNKIGSSLEEGKQSKS